MQKTLENVGFTDDPSAVSSLFIYCPLYVGMLSTWGCPVSGVRATEGKAV